MDIGPDRTARNGELGAAPDADDRIRSRYIDQDPAPDGLREGHSFCFVSIPQPGTVESQAEPARPRDVVVNYPCPAETQTHVVVELLFGL
jgi:hypothetical protein